MLEVKTEKDVIDFVRAISLSLAQVLHFKSKLYEPGATLHSLEMAINGWNAACVEFVGVDIKAHRFYLFVRDPSVLLETDDEGKTYIWDDLQAFVKENWGWDLLEAKYDPRTPEPKGIKLYGEVWQFFGKDLEPLLEDNDEAKELLNLYFGTYQEPQL